MRSSGRRGTEVQEIGDWPGFSLAICSNLHARSVCFVARVIATTLGNVSSSFIITMSRSAAVFTAKLLAIALVVLFAAPCDAARPFSVAKSAAAVLDAAEPVNINKLGRQAVVEEELTYEWESTNQDEDELP